MTASTTVKKLIRLLAPVIFWLGLWQLVSMWLGKPLLLPSPAEVARTLCSLAVTGAFWLSTGATLLRIVSGTLLGVLAGVLLALLTHFSAPLDALLSPAVRVLRATPVVSFIILIILWTGSNYVPVVICAMMVTPVVWENLRAGLSSADPELLELSRAYSMTPSPRLRYIYAPATLPYLRSGVLRSLGLAWKSGIAAEVLCPPVHAVGSKLQAAKVALETADLFAWTLVVAALSLLLEKGLRFLLERRAER